MGSGRIDTNGALHDTLGRYAEQGRSAPGYDLTGAPDEPPAEINGLYYRYQDGDAVVADARGKAVPVPQDFDGLVLNLAEEGEDGYHQDPRASYSTMKRFLATNPALFKWQSENPREQSKAMGFGSEVHAALLGTPMPVEEIDPTEGVEGVDPDRYAVTDEFTDFRSAAAKAFKANAEAQGKEAVVRAKYDQMVAEVEAKRADRRAVREAKARFASTSATIWSYLARTTASLPCASAFALNAWPRPSGSR